MLTARWFTLTLVLSLPVMAKVSFDEKIERVQLLKNLAGKTTFVDLEVYERELTYEGKELPIAERANLEANLFISRVQLTVLQAYEAALKETGDADAAENDVKAGILKDAELADPSLREELVRISLNALESARTGGISSPVKSKAIFRNFFRSSQERSAFLNFEECCDVPVKGGEPAKPSINTSKDSEKKEFRNKQELLESLASDRESVRWVAAGHQTFNTAVIRKREANISLQVKMEFLGVTLNAGPEISFKREFSTKATILAEGLQSALNNDGNFDYYKRDRDGNIIIRGGVQQKRYMSLVCSAELIFKTEYSGTGGFKFMGAGGDVSVSSEYGNTVILASRRIALPEYVEGKTVTLKYISDLCHGDFLSAQVNRTMTIKQTLELMMKNQVASLRFSHPKTKCATDEHCYNWYHNEIIALARVKNYPRCVEEKREKYMACELRGLSGQKCAVYDKAGKRISDGIFEFACDKGLKCVQTKTGGWFSNWEIYEYPEGRCKPINASSYQNPIAKQSNYLRLELAN